MEETLNNYYKNLNPDELAAQGNQAAQQQYQNSMRQVNEQLAAQGIGNSGMQAQMGMQMGNQMAQTKAQNQMNAPHQVAQQQQGWNSYLANQSNTAFNQMGQGVNAQQAQGNAYTNAYGNLANMYGNVGSMYGNKGNAIGNLGQMQSNIGGMYGGMGNAYANQATQANQLANNYGNQANQALQSGLGLGAYIGEENNWWQKPVKKGTV